MNLVVLFIFFSINYSVECASADQSYVGINDAIRGIRSFSGWPTFLGGPRVDAQPTKDVKVLEDRKGSVEKTFTEADILNLIKQQNQQAQKSYPIYKVHKYNGIEVRPIPVHLVNKGKFVAVPKTKNAAVIVEEEEEDEEEVENSDEEENTDDEVNEEDTENDDENEISDDDSDNEEPQPSDKKAKKSKPNNVSLANAPADLQALAKQLGITDASQLPSIKEAMNLLGTTTRKETIAAIRELASTPDGVELIRSYVDSNAQGSEDIEHYERPDEQEQRAINSYPGGYDLPAPNSQVNFFQTYQPVNSFRPSATISSNGPQKSYGPQQKPRAQIVYRGPEHQLNYGPQKLQYNQNGLNQLVRQPISPNLVYTQNNPTLRYVPVRIAPSTPKPVLTQSALSLTGIPLTLQRQSANLEIAQNIFPPIPDNSTSFGILERLNGFRNLFSFSRNFRPEIQIPTTERNVIPVLQKLPKLNSEFMKGDPKIPELPQVYIPKGVPLAPPFNNGQYIRVKLPNNGFNPLQRDIPRQNFLPRTQFISTVPNFAGYKSPIPVYSQQYSRVPVQPQRVLETPNQVRVPFVSNQNIRANEIQPIINKELEPPAVFPAEVVSENDYSVTKAETPSDFSKLPLDNYNAFRQGPRILTSYGVPALPYTFPEDDEVDSDDDEYEASDIQYYVPQASEKKEIIVAPPPKKKIPVKKFSDEKKVSRPQRLTPHDYTTGKIHKANPDAINLLPLTVHQTSVKQAKAMAEKENQDEAIHIIDAINQMTSDGI